MKVWHFSELPFPPAWDADAKVLRVTFPNKHFDPKQGSVLINERLDEWALCDELGLNIMVNEHHNTSTCLNTSCLLPLAMMARETKKARLLVLGVPIGIRNDPLLIAEEVAYIDVVSGGRVELGLVKGVPVELPSFNVSPSTQTARFWEAHDLILKAMTYHDGPFNFEGEFFQYRHANIWPRPYQEPHPPIWFTSFGPQSTAAAADRGYRITAGFSAVGAKAIFEAYRARMAEIGKPRPPADNFGYLSAVAVGHTREEGLRRANEINRFYQTSGLAPEPFQNPPGLVPVEANVQWIRRGQKKARGRVVGRDGKIVEYATGSLQDFIASGLSFAGTPDDVFEQLKDFYDFVGGCGNLLAMMHGGALSHADTSDSLRLFSKEVLPRLQEFQAQREAEAGAPAPTKKAV